MLLLKPPLLAKNDRTIVRSRAPLRISFCGGGTDVPPYPERFGGCVLSATIDKYAHVSTRGTGDLFVRAVCEEQGVDAVFQPRGGLELEGKMDLAQAIFRRFSACGLECYINADAPPGSGLGSSSTMIVALIEALCRQCNMNLSKDEKAELAIEIERNDLHIMGGMQDQYAASFGGFNFIEFTGSGTFVTPLRLPEETIADLHLHLLLCYTGKTRFSGAILSEQTANVVNEDPLVLDSLATLKELTIELKRSLLKGRLFEFGSLLDEAWSLKRNLASSITNSHIDEIYEAAKSAGALGGKLLGAGGGGHLLLFVPFNKRVRVRTEMERFGGHVVDFQFERQGAVSWMSTDRTWT